jgi:citrate lyase subunit beta/citryl-CoA lyase
MCEKAATSGPDLVFLDLEDACAPVAKEGARATAVAALTGQDWGRTLRAVRVNGVETPWCHGDIIEVVTGARDALDVLIVPKDAVEIAKASDRLEAIIFGAGDLSASQRARVDGNFDPVGEYRATSGTSPASRSSPRRGPPASTPSTPPIPAYTDPESYRRSAVHASLLGFDGKWAIHPSQIAIAHEVFSPTEAEIEDARQSIETYRRSEAEGVGAIGRDGRLVDAAHMRLAENILYKAALASDERGVARTKEGT